jgi:hypothetical protein
VRFKEQNRVIYLQIQVGKLLAIGLVDQKTIKWQVLPGKDSLVVFDYNYRKLKLSTSKLKNGAVVTGKNILINLGHTNFYIIFQVCSLFGKTKDYV